MNTAIKLALSACAIAVFANSAEAKGGKCVNAGGEATMVTEDLAKYMAGAALKNALAAHNWTGKGAIKTKCDTANGLPHCVSRQKACG